MTHLRTTTTGLSDLVRNMSPFQIMSAEKTIIARLRAWCRRRRLFFQSFFSSYDGAYGFAGARDGRAGYKRTHRDLVLDDLHHGVLRQGDALSTQAALQSCSCTRGHTFAARAESHTRRGVPRQAEPRRTSWAYAAAERHGAAVGCAEARPACQSHSPNSLIPLPPWLGRVRDRLGPSVACMLRL